jgi:hypothetical protein
MWINCYATIYSKKALALYMRENQPDDRLSHRPYGVVTFFCLTFDRFFLMYRKSTPLETNAWGLRLRAFSESKRGVLPNRHALFHSKRVDFVNNNRDRS